MDETERNALIAHIVRTSKLLFTVDEVALLTQRHRQAIERLIRWGRINSFTDNNPDATYKHMIPARQVAAMLETPSGKHMPFVAGMPIDEARREAVARRQERRRAIRVTIR